MRFANDFHSRDFVTRENHWQIASLVTKKSLFTVTHALFFISYMFLCYKCEMLYGLHESSVGYVFYLLASTMYGIVLLFENMCWDSYHQTMNHNASWVLWIIPPQTKHNKPMFTFHGKILQFVGTYDWGTSWSQHIYCICTCLLKLPADDFSCLGLLNLWRDSISMTGLRQIIFGPGLVVVITFGLVIKCNSIQQIYSQTVWSMNIKHMFHWEISLSISDGTWWQIHRFALMIYQHWLWYIKFVLANDKVTGGFPSQRASYRKTFPCHVVIMILMA